MKSVAIVTPWFPNRPGEWPGAFIADSALAVEKLGWRTGNLVVRPWLPARWHHLAHEMVRGDVCTAAFPVHALETVRVPTLPRFIMRSVTDVFSDRVISRSLATLAKAISADVIHAQTEGLAPAAASVARRLRLPLLVTLHGRNMHPRYLSTSYQKRRLRPALADADRIILVGESLREFFKLYIGNDKNFHVVPNGIDFPQRGSDWTNFENRPWRLVSVSNLHEGKGIDLTLQALACLSAEGISEWTYQVIGDGRDKAALVKLAAKLGLSSKVSFIGSVRHSEIFEYIAPNDIFVLPSSPEAFGIAYLEAMAAGLITIGVIGEGPSQFIRNGENGLLVPPRDINALVQVLRDIFTGDRNRWREIARRARETVLNAYTWNQHATQLVAHYEHAINNAQKL